MHLLLPFRPHEPSVLVDSLSTSNPFQGALVRTIYLEPLQNSFTLASLFCTGKSSGSTRTIRLSSAWELLPSQRRPVEQQRGHPDPAVFWRRRLLGSPRRSRHRHSQGAVGRPDRRLAAKADTFVSRLQPGVTRAVEQLCASYAHQLGEPASDERRL